MSRERDRHAKVNKQTNLLTNQKTIYLSHSLAWSFTLSLSHFMEQIPSREFSIFSFIKSTSPSRNL